MKPFKSELKTRFLVILFNLFSFMVIISGQYYPNYQNYGQQPYPNIPTEIIDVPPGINVPQKYPINNSPYPPQYKPNNYIYPYPYNYGMYPQVQQTFQALPSFQQPIQQQPQIQNFQGYQQIPRRLFKKPTAEFPNGYYVIPGSQHEVFMQPEGIDSPKEANGTVQEHPGYVIKQTSQRYQSPNQNPTKITSSTVEYKPFRTVLTRYIDRNGKPIIKLENENGTLTLTDKGSTNLSINNGKLEINGVDPSSPTTTTEADELTSEPENATPRDVSSWI